MCQSVMQKILFAVFKVKVTVRAYMIEIWLFLLHLLNCKSLATKLGLMVHHHTPECPVKKLITAFKVKVTVMVQMSMDVCLDDIF